MSDWKPGMAPRVEGYGLLLRGITPGEIDDRFVAELRNPAVSRTLALGRDPGALTRDNLRHWLARFDNRISFFLGIYPGGGGKRLGFCWSLPESADVAVLTLGITDPDSWRKGAGHAATYLLRCFMFDAVKVHKVVARVYADNPDVVRRAKESGWVPEGLLREAEPDGKGGRRDVHVFGMLRADHLAGPKPRDYAA
jgi:RimJ/RimL family protein N-acetyltransferase